MKLNIVGFFKDAVRLPFDTEKPIRSFFQKIFRIFLFSLKSFFKNECFLKSSILTFYALISIVPVLAIIFAIAKAFGFEAFLQKEILQTFKEQESVLTTAMRFAYAFIGHIKSQAIAGIGAIFLFLSVFGLFENLEQAINFTWNVKKHRGFIRRSINYFASLVIFPIIFIASTSITIFINSEVVKTIESYEFLKYVSTYVLTALQFVPYALMCLLFSYIYIFTPNTKIYLKSRIFAGILAGAFFQFWQIIYINFQVYISTYNLIYGSFAALPLFLIWLQVNFVILLFGAEIAAQIEGDRFFRKTSDKDNFRLISQKQFTLLVLYEITSHFLKGGKPLTIEYIAEHLGISLLDAREVLSRLERAGMIAEIVGFRSMEKYQLIVNPELFTIQSICDFIDKTSLRQIRSKETDSLHTVVGCFTNFEKLIQDSGTNFNLKDFANLKPPGQT